MKRNNKNALTSFESMSHYFQEVSCRFCNYINQLTQPMRWVLLPLKLDKGMLQRWSTPDEKQYAMMEQHHKARQPRRRYGC